MAQHRAGTRMHLFGNFRFGQGGRSHRLFFFTTIRLKAIAIRLEVIASRLEASKRMARDSYLDVRRCLTRKTCEPRRYA